MTITIRKNILMLLHIALLVLAVLALNWQEKNTEGNDPGQPDLEESIVWQVSGTQEAACCLQKAKHVAQVKKGSSLTFANFMAGVPLLRKKQPCQKTIGLRKINLS